MLLVTSFNFNYEHKPQVIACKVIGFIFQLALWVKLLFVNAFVFHFFALAVFTRDLKKLEPLYILFSILLPVLFTWVPFINDSYGISGAWCWIRVWKDECATQKYIEGIIFQFALWYGPLFFCLTVTVGMAITILIILGVRACKKRNQPQHLQQENGNQQQNQKALKELSPLMAYPIIFYFMTLLPLSNRIHGAISQRPSFSLTLTHAVIVGQWSLFSSIALLIHICCDEKVSQENEKETFDCGKKRQVSQDN